MPLGKTVGKKMEYWGDGSTDLVLKVKQRRKIRRCFQVVIYYSCQSPFNLLLILTTIAASYLLSRGGEIGGERGLKKKKKKVRFPAISPQATRGIFVPFFILHRFGVETCIRGKPGSSAFFASSAPRIQKDFLKRRRKKEATVLSAT